MEPVRLWAAVVFTAQNGSPEALLTDAAGQGLHLYGISPLPGGFCAHCAAPHYLRLAKLARRRLAEQPGQPAAQCPPPAVCSAHSAPSVPQC